ncbi:hypothetical protein MTQ01_01920 [Streptomyces sp. XM4193]|uniref:hypothetical protein n=1 Tax=Streptomyces sp. XM4193 TaxID=2929782 RepID=UPI001FF7FAD9|nr:hypothetical protein [Streptomyces sp. XM4193]MCK1794801.1 hypothetical protein [Streptomyces sp. XM4193]
MRRTANGAVLATAVALVLTGCGSDGGDSEDGAKKDTASSGPSDPNSGSDDSSSGDGGSDDGASQDKGSDGSGDADGETREVTLEVTGEGTVLGAVIYMTNEMKTETVKKLPWTKTETLALRGAETEVGRAVTLTPPSVQNPDGKLVPARCVIKVDGKTIADNADNDPGDSSCKASVK